jgi:hypothetical protein
VTILVSPALPLLIAATAVAGWLCIASGRPGLMAICLFLVFQDPLRILFGSDSSAAIAVKRADEFLVLLYGGYIALSRPLVRRILWSTRVFLAILGCYVALSISTVLHGTSLLPAVVDFMLFSKPFLILTIGCSIVSRGQGIGAAITRLSVGMALVLSFGLVFLAMPSLQGAYLEAFKPYEERLGFLVAQGFFINSGTFSWFAAVSFCVAYAAYLVFTRRHFLLLAAFSALLVLLAWRRKSLVAIALVLLASLFARSIAGTKIRLSIVIAAVVIITCTILSPYFGALADRTVDEYGSSDPYATARSALYYSSYLIATDHFPLGTGFATFGSFASALYYSDVYLHYGLQNVYGLSSRYPIFITDTFWPMVLGQGGIAAITCYALFFWILLRRTWSASRQRHESPTHNFAALCALFVLLASFAESVASHIYGSSLQAALVFLPIGFFLSTFAQGHDERSAHQH